MQDIEERRAQLRDAIDEYWEDQLREAPEFATIIGDYRHNDRWSDFSLDHLEQRRRELGEWKDRFEALDATGLSEQEQLDRLLILRDLEEEIEDFELRNYEMPVDQLHGIHLTLAHFVSNVPFDSAERYEQFLVRLDGIPRLMDQVTELLRQGQADGLMPPRYLLEKTVEQCRAIAKPVGEANVFGRPVTDMPGSIPGPESARLRDAVLAAVDGRVRPAYAGLAEFIAETYAPGGRVELGVWSLPQGAARYRFALRRYTTTDMDPEEIHALGVEEVARIEADQSAIARGLGFADLDSFRRSLKDDPKLVPGSREQILEAYRGYVDQMRPELPKLFGLLPQTPLEVRPTPEYREREAPGAQYDPGTPDGSRPGVMYVNTGDYEHRSLTGIEATAYHEGLPGHHLQMAIAQGLPLPAFRRHAYYGAYIEGWALYAERLGKELGFYQDPYSDFGRLSQELFRAARLVVDTGVHHWRWTRESMVEYLRTHSDEDEPDIQAEVDRYIVLPGQAVSYKVGQLSLLRLRERATTELGSGYDQRAFHDRILDGGALPLDILEARLDAWIRQQKARAPRE